VCRDLYSSDDERNVENSAQFHRTVQNLFEEEEKISVAVVVVVVMMVAAALVVVVICMSLL
jgi:hypothetical protein